MKRIINKIREKQDFSQIVFLITILSIYSLAFTLMPDGLPSGHDAYAHATYTKIFFEAISQGQLPVRWTEWIVGGHGQPLFNFYQSGFYYLATVISFLHYPFVSTFKFTLLFCWWFGTFFIFLYTLRFGKLASAVASLIYAFSPYLALDIFIRASYPEFMALSLMPALLWSLDKLLTQTKISFVFVFAFFLAVVMFTHLPTLLIFSPILFFYTVCLLVRKELQIRNSFWLFLAGVIGLGMASFYVIPALTELGLVRSYTLTEGRFDFHQNFASISNIYSYIWGYNGDWWGQHIPQVKSLSFLHLIIFFASLWVLLFSYFKTKKINIWIVFWLGVICFSLFMQVPNSLFIWEKIPYLRFLQFPWRFFMAVPIAIAILSAICVSQIQKEKIQLVAVLLVVIVCLTVYRPFFAPQTFYYAQHYNLPYDQWLKNGYTKKQAFIESGYNPVQVKKLPTDDRGRWQHPSGANVEEKMMKFDRMAFTTESKNAFTLPINTHYFPYWRAYIDGRETHISQTEDYDFIDVEVPSGTHTVSLIFMNTPARNIGNILTLLFLVIWFGGVTFLSLRKFHVVRLPVKKIHLKFFTKFAITLDK